MTEKKVSAENTTEHRTRNTEHGTQNTEHKKGEEKVSEVIKAAAPEAPLTVEKLFKAGTYFGHKKSRRNPKMDEFVYTYREGVAIIDIKKTLSHLEKALAFLEDSAASGKPILFAGTKKHVREMVRETAQGLGMPFVNIRWLGGTFTNFEAINGRVEHLKDLERRIKDDDFPGLTKLEKLKKKEEAEKLDEKLGGLREMGELPAAMFVLDVKQDALAIKEANRTGVPVVAIVDTNDTPEGAAYIIPANNDAISSVRLILGEAAGAIEKGGKRVKGEERKAKNA